MLMKEKSRLRVWFNSLSLRVMAGTIFLTLTAALFIGALAGMFIRRQLKDQLAAQSRQQAEYLMRTVDIGVIAPCYSEISHLRVNARSAISRPDQRAADGTANFDYSAVGKLLTLLRDRVTGSDSLFHSISVCYRTPGVLLSTREGITFLGQPGNSQMDADWIRLYEEEAAGTFRVCFLPVRDYPGNVGSVLSVVVPLSTADSDVLLCLNVDAKVLQRFLSQTAGSESCRITLRDAARDRLIYETGSLPEPSDGSSDLLKAQADSQYLSWQCILLSEPPVLFQDVSLTSLIYAGGGILVLLLSLGVFLSVKSTYKTSRSITEAARLLNPDPDALRSLDKAVLQLEEGVSRQKSYILQSQTLVRNSFLLSLLEGRPLPPEEQQQISGFLKLSFPYRFFNCCVLQYRTFSGEVTEEAFHLVWEQFRSCYEQEPLSLEYCRISGEQLALILNYEDEDFSPASLAEQLSDAMESRFDVLIHCGAGAGGNSRDALPILYEQARSALRYRDLYPHRFFFPYEETSLWDQNLWNREGFPEFAAALSRGEEGPCLEALECFFRRLIKDRLSYASYREMVDAVLREVESFAQQNLMDLRDLFPAPLSELFRSLSDSEQVLARLSAMIRQILAASRSGDTARNTVVIRKALRFIQEHYAEDLSVQDIADAVSLSRYHLSRLFKEATGVTLLACLNDVRMKKARELLEQGGLTVSEISLRVGFRSASYFDKKFKQFYGCSPAGVQPPPTDEA